jgi:hypothetical protein
MYISNVGELSKRPPVCMYLFAVLLKHNQTKPKEDREEEEEIDILSGMSHLSPPSSTCG